LCTGVGIFYPRAQKGSLKNEDSSTKKEYVTTKKYKALSGQGVDNDHIVKIVVLVSAMFAIIVG
jgi:hypothetical protein